MFLLSLRSNKNCSCNCLKRYFVHVLPGLRISITDLKSSRADMLQRLVILRLQFYFVCALRLNCATHECTIERTLCVWLLANAHARTLKSQFCYNTWPSMCCDLRISATSATCVCLFVYILVLWHIFQLARNTQNYFMAWCLLCSAAQTHSIASDEMMKIAANCTRASYN